MGKWCPFQSHYIYRQYTKLGTIARYIERLFPIRKYKHVLMINNPWLILLFRHVTDVVTTYIRWVVFRIFSATWNIFYLVGINSDCTYYLIWISKLKVTLPMTVIYVLYLNRCPGRITDYITSPAVAMPPQYNLRIAWHVSLLVDPSTM